MSLASRADETLLTAFFLGLFAAIFSLIFLPYYINGDQKYYIDLYHGLSDRDFVSAFSFYKLRIGSAEPGYFIAAWIFAQLGISKLFFTSLLNGTFAFFVVLFFRRSQASILVLIILLFFNYYSYVLFLSAERLKFSLLVFIIALYFRDKKVGKLFLIFSWLSHVQIILLSIALYSPNLLQKIKNILYYMKISYRDVWLFLGLLISMSLVLVFLSEHIKNKMVYLELRGVQESFKAFSFMVMALVISSKKVSIVAIFVVLFVSITFLGEERINIFAFYIFLYFSFSKNSGLNIISALPLIYFAITGVLFMERVIRLGTGYLE